MHRKISQEAQDAFEAGRTFSKSNTVVTVGGNTVSLLLHGNRIAWRVGDRLFFSMCGRDTPTTRERLGAAGVCIGQHKHRQYFLNGVSWANDVKPKEFYSVPVDPYAEYEIVKDKLVLVIPM